RRGISSDPPTPSEVLSASSIRMMLGLASAFRKTNPAVLDVMCGTMIDLLLEAPPLVLAPLHAVPLSIEASTFRRVGLFCAELAGSPDNDEREPALGLYMALAISRGQVSGLFEIVRFLLGHCRQERHCARNVGVVVGEVPRSPISAVLDRLANHSVHLHLLFPDEWKGARLVIRVPRVASEVSNVSTPLSDHPASLEDIEPECLASAATDGKFVYVWHPEIGLLKAGTGLGGTTKERVYAQNLQAGVQDKPVKSTGNKDDLVAVIGDMLYLQTGP
ncbi:unnamed protein product, partial [Hapterophycus canaliculatus]